MLKEIIEYVKEYGGITWDYREEMVQERGYAVAVNKTFEVEIGTYNLDEKELIKYIHEHFSILHVDGYCLGIWVHNHICFLDVVRIFKYAKDALEYGKNNQQTAIYDLDNQQEIYL